MKLKPQMHVLMAQQFKSTGILFDLFKTTDRIKEHAGDNGQSTTLSHLLDGLVMYEIFYEPSSRTRFSFGAAARMLGMSVDFTESAGQFSSAVKGETLEHSIRIFAGQRVHVIVIRHPETGAAQRAAVVVDKYYPGKVSIINAGDGRGQHPTQALLDVYTIWQKLQRLDNLNVVIVGDLANGRTCRSLAYLLSKFSGIKITFLSPPELAVGDDILRHLTESGVDWSIGKSLREALPTADVVYCTRIQKERMSDHSRLEEYRNAFFIGASEMRLLKSDGILMHPLPIVGEIDSSVDDHPQAVYFDQANNGQYIRAALLLHIFGVSVP